MKARLCERTVVILPGALAADNEVRQRILTRLSEWGEIAEVHWDTNAPDKSAEDIRQNAGSAHRALVYMARPHAKALKDVQRIAAKCGLQAVIADMAFAADLPAFDPREDFVFEPHRLDKRDDRGPFDIIGDVHGCALELMDLLTALGHAKACWEEMPKSQWQDALVPHEDGRKVILLGDLVDRGPDNLAVLRITRRLEELGGFYVLGNHDSKIGRYLIGRDVRLGPHQEGTVREFEVLTADERREWGEWLLDAETHYLLDEGRLIVAHAGLDEEHQGKTTKGAQAFALYGKQSECGRVDDDGWPLGEDWAQTYKGTATVVHGHIVHKEPRCLNNVLSIDTGVVFGGKLTALRWPERAFVDVPARRTWWSAK